MEMNTCRMSHVLGKLCDATIFAHRVARAVARDKQCDKRPGFLMRSRYARRVWQCASPMKRCLAGLETVVRPNTNRTTIASSAKTSKG
jgi:hypothetical protein